MSVCGTSAFSSLGCVPSVGIAGSDGDSVFNCSSNYQTFPRVTALFSIPTSSVREFQFFPSRPTLVIVCLFYGGHPSECDMVPCGFTSHFSDGQGCWGAFYELISHSYIFFGGMSIQTLYPFLICLSFYYWLVGDLYVFWICLLLGIWCAKNFFHYSMVGFSLSNFSFMVSLNVQKVLIWGSSVFLFFPLLLVLLVS